MKKKWAPFSYIEELQGDSPFGRVLDAGTGPRSIGWLRGLDTDSITAVAGDKRMERQVAKVAGDWRRPQDQVVVGNWADPDLLAGEKFDTVVADYLLGAVEGFAPYFQSDLFARLRPLTEKRLYLIGVEPYVGGRPKDQAGVLVWGIGRYRDACLLLLGKRPYREYPVEWVERHLGRSGFESIGQRKFAASYSADFVNRQIDTCRKGLEAMPDNALGNALIAQGETLRTHALGYIEAHGALRHGFSYVVAAKPV